MVDKRVLTVVIRCIRMKLPGLGHNYIPPGPFSIPWQGHRTAGVIRLIRFLRFPFSERWTNAIFPG